VTQPSLPLATRNGRSLSRSDGATFQLVAAEVPIRYPARTPGASSEVMSVGFWYRHKRNGSATEASVVVLTRAPRHPVALERQVQTIADRLAWQLAKSSRLSTLYEFDGRRLARKG